jgi:PIN domain nuclease of toxin-antitoxin system
VGGPALTGLERPDAPGASYLLDTHIWLWYMLASSELPSSLRDEIDTAVGRLWISPMTIWEVGMLHVRGRIELRDGPRQWIDTALQQFPLAQATLSAEVAIRSHEIDLGHRDPVDHIIAATALVHDLTLMTVDVRMATASWLPTRSA